MKHGKKYTDSAKLIDRAQFYEPEAAIELIGQIGKAKFDETVELLFVWALTRGMRTSSFAARLFCRTGQVKP
jgi:ribosomal protein L1